MNFLRETFTGLAGSPKTSGKVITANRSPKSPSRTTQLLPNAAASHKQFKHHSLQRLPRSSRGIPNPKQFLAPPLQTIMEERQSLFQTQNSTDKHLLSSNSLVIAKEQQSAKRLALTSIPAIADFCQTMSLPLQLSGSNTTAMDLEYSKSHRHSITSRQDELMLSLRTNTQQLANSCQTLSKSNEKQTGRQFNIEYARLLQQNQAVRSGCCCVDEGGWHSTPQEYSHSRTHEQFISAAVAPGYR